MKESDVTAHVNRFAALHSQVSSCGIAAVLDQCTAWNSGLQNLKSFLKQHREWKKTMWKHSRFLGLHSILNDLKDFLQGLCQITPAPSLRILFARSEFFQNQAFIRVRV